MSEQTTHFIVNSRQNYEGGQAQVNLKYKTYPQEGVHHLQNIWFLRHIFSLCTEPTMKQLSI